MATGILRPNATVTNEWYIGNHTGVDEDVTQPNIPTGYPDDWASDPSDDNEIIVMGFPNTIDDVDEVTNITVWTYGETMEDDDPEVSVNMGGWQVDQQCNLPPFEVPNWTFNSFNGSWTQANLDALQVRFTADTPSKYGSHDLWCIYVVVTYDAVVPEGYGHDYMGVPAANIGSVSGVPTGNIDKIKGV